MSHLERRPPQFFNFNSSKWSLLNETEILLVSAIIANNQDTGKETVTNLRAFGVFSPLTFLTSSHYSVTGLWGPTGALPNPRLNHLVETFLQTGTESLPVLTDTRVTHSVLHPTTIKQPGPLSTKTVQIVGSLMNLKRFLSLNLFPFL